MQTPLAVLIAGRNLLRHKGKSLVIGVILFLGSLLMTIGNGVISGMDHGIEKNIVNGFMGDIVLIAAKEKSDNVLFEMMGGLVEPITNYPQIKPILQSQPFVQKFLPVGKNLGMVLSDDDSVQPGYIYLLGVDFTAHQAMFPGSLKLLEGRFLQPGERGMLVPVFARKEFYDYSNRWLLPEGGQVVESNLTEHAKQEKTNLITMDNVVVMGMTTDNSSTDIRLGVKGIVKYKSLDTFFGHFCLVDIASYRECMGYFEGGARSAVLPKATQTLLALDNANLDDLFGQEALVVENQTNRVQLPSAEKTAAPAAIQDQESGLYNMVFIKLKPGLSRAEAIQNLNQEFATKKAGVRAVSWNKAAGPIGSMTILIKGSLVVFVSLLFVVAVIIIINTLTMAAMERVPEIGMMRAIGAGRMFIRAMFIAETGILAAIFGGLGLVLGIAAIEVIPLFNITTTNDFVQLLYGGDTFHPMLQWYDIVLTVTELALVTLAASLYPAVVAGNIKPLDAVVRD